MNINVGQLVMKRVSVCGSPIGNREDYESMLRIAAEKNIGAKVELFPMSEVSPAIMPVEGILIKQCR